MGKNGTMADSIDDKLVITRDKSFKDIVKYKGLAAIIIQAAIPEFKNHSLVEIARLIVNTRYRKPNMSDTDILDDEIDFLPSNTGTGDEKTIIHDAAFRIKLNNRIIGVRLGDNLITVNTEMQNKSNNLKYNIASRAVYYAASLLRDTVPSKDTDYNGIHKVYSIWLCTENVAYLQDLQDANGLHEGYFKNQCIHRIGMRRFYPEISNQVVKAEKETDLLEVVIIELSKLKGIDSESLRLLRGLFFDTVNVVDEIDKIECVSLAKLKKEVIKVVDTDKKAREMAEEIVEERVKEIVEERVKEKAAESLRNERIQAAKKLLVNTGISNKPIDECIRAVKNILGYDADITEEAMRLIQTEL